MKHIFLHIAGWITDERIHAFWSANILSYPLSKDGLHNYLVEQNLKFLTQPYDKTSQNKVTWNETFQNELSGNKKGYDGAYVYADENDCPVGFFVYTVNRQDKSGFVRFIVRKS